MPPKKFSTPTSQGGSRIIGPDPVTGSTNHLHPVFCFHYLQDDYGIKKCEDDDKCKLLESLRQLSQITWGDLGQISRHKNGYEQIPKSAIKPPIPAFVTDETDKFFVFRFSGMKSMIGLREHQVFKIIWLDFNFNVYKH